MNDTNKIYYCRETQATNGTIISMYEDYACSGIAVGGYLLDIQGNKTNEWGVAKQQADKEVNE